MRKFAARPGIFTLFVVTLMLACCGHVVRGQEVADDAAQTSSAVQPGELRFAFEGVAWRDVIRWLADEAELALHVTDLPTGSFTYSDNSSFTPNEAINRVNLFLIPQGFALVRSGRLLSVINLADARSRQQLDAIATLVRVDALAKLEDQDVVKCIFPLGEFDAQEAVDELSVLNLMTNPEVLERTNQLIIIDTASKLRNVKAILDAYETDTLDNGTVVQSFALQHVDAEDILLVARPHLGLATDELIGIDVSLSADPQGKNIFATGVKDKVKVLEGLVKAIDRPAVDASATLGESVLQAHPVEGGNVQMVYDVLQTLLAGRDVRLSMDETANSVVALAPKSIQKEIEGTVELLKASEADFEVIPLRNSDAYFVVSLLEEMLDLPDSFTDPDDIDPDTPKIDADPSSNRLFVRAKRAQIDQIKKIVEGLDATPSRGGEPGRGAPVDDLRILPLRGKAAEQALEIAAKFWRDDNPIVLLRSGDAQGVQTERVINEPERPKTPAKPITLSATDSRDQRWLTSNTNSRAASIRCQITSRGLLIQSDDAEALDRFEQHLITIAGPTGTSVSPPIAFYLKYTKANDAVRVLAELLDGGDALADSEGGSLVNGFVSSTDSLFGSLVTSRDGTLTLTGDTMTVVADTRLNRLIAQGTEADIERIEQYLQIIDKDTSITAVETYGSAHVIELVNTRASEVAESLREAFAGRVAASTSRGAAANSQQSNSKGAAQQQAQRGGGDEKRAPEKGGEKGNEKASNQRNAQQGGRGAVRDLEPKMTIAVHEPSNSLIITAPDSLYVQAEKLAREIDQRGQQFVEVMTPSNGAVFEAVLQQVLLGETTSSRGSSSRGSTTGSANTPSRTARPQTSKPPARSSR